MSKRQILIVLGLAVLLAAGVGAWIFLGSSNDGTVLAAEGGGPGYVLTEHDRVLGDRKAKVVVIEYAAPVCPHCAAFNAEVIPLLKAKYVDTGKVLYVLRLFPLMPADGLVEKMARCLPEDNYFPFIDLMFRNQSKWDPEYQVADLHAALIQMGRIAGMAPDEADKCMNDKSLDETINQVAQDGEKKYHITGTPTIVINGVAQPSGNVPWATMQKLIDAELAKKT